MGAVTPAGETVAAAVAGLNLFPDKKLSNSEAMMALAQQLYTCTQPIAPSEHEMFSRLCIALAKRIDYAAANKEIPHKVQDLPSVIKKVCQNKNDNVLLANILVLMLSVKTACKEGWFSDKETEELVALASEIGRCFCNSGDINNGLINSHDTVQAIMSRFYPLMRMGEILASCEVKPGFGSIVFDIHLSMDTVHSSEENVRLFVARTDSIETSACIISPKDVNFLINGTAVPKRTNILMDTAPQLPTNMTTMLTYGANLLQALGRFDGNYIIVVALMSMLAPPEAPVLPDYVQSSCIEADSEDSDIIEGPSRVSLNCPISRSRIKTPVKGHACKHYQCFDFNNYIDINAKSPSWRCPHCNQHVCYSEIRIDQNMVKVLKEVAGDVSNVIISANGSWRVVLESDDYVSQGHHESHQEESSSRPNAVPTILDLTQENDEIETLGSMETDDRKPSIDIADLQRQYGATNLSKNDQNIAPQRVMNSFGAGLCFSQLPMTSSSRTATEVGCIMDSIPFGFTVSSMPTDSITSAVSQPEAGGNMYLTTPVIESHFSAPSNVQLQQSHLMNLMNEYDMVLQSTPGHTSRNPSAVEALPASSRPPKRSRTGLNTSTPNSLQAALSTARTAHGIDGLEQFSRPLSMASSSLQHHFVAQSWNQQHHSPVPGQSVQRVGVPALSQLLPGACLLSSGLPSGHQSNLRLSQSRGGSPNLGWSARGLSAQATSMAEASAHSHSPANQNSHPLGRMRGSIRAEACPSGLTPFLIQPTHSAQASRPHYNLTPPTMLPPSSNQRAPNK